MKQPPYALRNLVKGSTLKLAVEADGLVSLWDAETTVPADAGVVVLLDLTAGQIEQLLVARRLAEGQ